MTPHFNEVAASIPIADGWAVASIHYRDNDPVVMLECRGANGQSVSVSMDIDEASFKGTFPQPFTRRPPTELADNIRNGDVPAAVETLN